jgi:hypothetical protein
MQCFLQRTLRPGGQAAQYHFEGSYGVSVLFLAGRDTITGRASMEHAARFWVSGNTHPRSLDLQQQICQKLEALTEGTVVKAVPLPLQKGA